MSRTLLAVLLLTPVALAAPVPKGMKAKRPSVAETVVGSWRLVATDGQATDCSFSVAYADDGSVEFRHEGRGRPVQVTAAGIYTVTEPGDGMPFGAITQRLFAGRSERTERCRITTLSAETFEAKGEGDDGRTFRYERVPDGGK